MERALITGCSGYIGVNIIPHLKRDGFAIFGIDRKPCVSADLDGFLHGDLLDEKILKKSLDGIDTVIHLAASKDDWGITNREYFRDNFEATSQLIRIGREKNVKNFLFYSSVSVMGYSSVPLDEKTPLAPSTIYGKSKAKAEKLFHQFAKEDTKAKIVILRPSVVFGPGNPQNTNIYRLIEAIYKDRFFMIGNGEEIKTTSYIENVVAATMFLIHRIQRGVQTFIFVDDPKMSTAELVRHLCIMLQKNQPKLRLPLGVAVSLAYIADFAAAVMKKDFPITAARIKKFCTPTNYDASAIRTLGFRQPVCLEDALSHTIQWYLQSEKHGSPGE